MGTHAGKLSLEKDKIKAVLTDVEAPIKLDGLVLIALATRDYSLDLTIEPTATTDPILVQTLVNFFKQNDQGAYTFSVNSKF